MKDLFPGYYRPDEVTTKQIWDQCVFVLDANVLLNLYRYPITAKDEFLTLLESVKDRLWIPHHAALEFQRNRLTVIAEQKRRFREVRDITAGILSGLENDIDRLQLRKRHSLIDPDNLLDSLRPIIDQFSAELSNKEAGQSDVHEEDNLRIQIDSLLDGKVGNPATQESYDNIKLQGDRRYAALIPPGYLDACKADSKIVKFIHRGIEFDLQYGDLIIWEQIIDHCQENELRSVIFITDDEKEDWWLIVDSLGKRRLGPRPELVDEISRRGNVENFYMYTSSSFMHSASKYIDARVSPESIDQVKQISADIDFSLPPYYAGMRLALSRWLTTKYPNHIVDDGLSTGFDFIVRSKNGKPVAAYEYYPITGPHSIRTMSRAAEELATNAAEHGIDKYYLVAGAMDNDTFSSTKELLNIDFPTFPPSAELMLCLVRDARDEKLSEVASPLFFRDGSSTSPNHTT